MNNSKVWAVLGAMDGLGSAAIKYLVANNQIVIAFIKPEISIDTPFDIDAENLYLVPIESFSVKEIENGFRYVIARYGAIDFIINNSNYRLFHKAITKTSAEIQSDINMAIPATITLIKAIIPYLRRVPKGGLINIPPQLCLAVVRGKSEADKLAFSMELFLKTLQAELQELDCRLSFLKPGERFINQTT